MLFDWKSSLFISHAFFHHSHSFARQWSSEFAILTITSFKWFGKKCSTGSKQFLFAIWLMICLCIYTRLCTWVVGVTAALELTISPIKLKMSGVLLNCLWLGQNWNVWAEIFHSRFMHQTEFNSKHSDKIVHLLQRMRLGKVCCFTSFKEH